MPTMIESVINQLTPAIAPQIARKFGVEESVVRQGITLVVPLVVVAVTKLLAKPETAPAMEQALPKSLDLASISSGIANPPPGQADATNQLMGTLFGGQQDGVAKAVGSSAGMDGAALLGAVTPAVLGSIGSMAQTEHLDSAGLATRLQQDTDQFAASHGDAMGSITQMLEPSGGIGGFLKRIFG